MTLKRLLPLFALLGILISSMAFATPTMAGTRSDLPANEAVKYCRLLDERGDLDYYGLTRGECVNYYMRPTSTSSTNYIVSICGYGYIQDELGTTKGQCIKSERPPFHQRP